MNNKYKVVIIGCGVSGMCAALYLKRAGIDCLIIEKSMPGGQIIDNGNILNFPSYDNISGSDLALKMLKQVKDLDVLVKYEEVIKIDISNGKKIITDKNEYCCDYVIIATGRKPKMLGVDLEKELRGCGVSYCAVCDGSLYKNKEVVVIGGSDSAFESAIYLSNICSKVTILYRNMISAKKYLQDLVNEKNNIYLQQNEVLKFAKDNRIIVRTIDGSDLITDGVFIYVGQMPNSDFLSSLNILDDKGYVKVDSKLMCSIDGVYAVGDALYKEDYQIVIAMGEAARVALDIARRG